MLRVGETAERTDTGRQRPGNEDNMFARPPLFVVADGMGGAQAGEVASQIAIDTFAHGLPDTGSPEERLSMCVQEANRQIYELSRSENERAGMGTTLTAALLDDAALAVAHVGDSRAYLFRDGKLTRLTRDHSLVGELVRQGKLTEAQAEEHPQRSIITRALGPEETVEVDTWSYPMRADDVVLLCSDGLTSMVGEERIATILQEASDLHTTADRLIDEANEAGGRDNITVLLVRIEDVGSDTATEAPTMVGAPAPSKSDSDAVQPTPSTPAPPPTASATATVTPPATRRTRPPLARTQGFPAPALERRSRRTGRWIRPLAALAAVVIVLFLILGGGYLATRQLYFIGTDNQGVVTIYRGLPYDLPAGIHLYETFYVSGVAASQIPVDRRGPVLNHHLRSQKDASSLVRALELGQLAR